MAMATGSAFPVDFISHGGGPWPWMPEERDTVYAELAVALAAIIPTLPQRPEAILMISAHWEEDAFTVQSSPNPGMLYDYYGFPKYTYAVRYASSGSPVLADKVVRLLEGSGIPARRDSGRGYDHGMFSPMEVINPAADIPVIQLSLKTGLYPRDHILLGRALRPLRKELIFVVGSGLSYHNLRLFNRLAGKPSGEFDAWLNETVTQTRGIERNTLLEQWESAPSARICHPRSEHLIPLMVAVGCAEGEYGITTYNQKDFMGGIHVSNFRFG